MWALAVMFATTAAAPVNDSFAQRAVLTDIGAGTTVEATLEPGEVNPAGAGGASVWWSWTAASAGWVSFSTSGSNVDTVLLVFSGSDLTSLTYRGGNDNASATTLASQVVLKVAAGETLHLAVHGRQGAAGAVALSAGPWVEPEPRVTSLGISRTTVDVGAAAQTVTFTMGIDVWDAYGAGEIAFTGRLLTAGFTPLQHLTGGDTLFGTYQQTLTFPQGMPPGDYWLELGLTRLSGGLGSLGLGSGEGQVFPAGAPVKITVLNSDVVDTVPPVLTSLDVTPAVVDVGQGEKTVRSLAGASDALTGLHSVRLAWIHSTNGARLGGGSAASALVVRRTAQPGTYTAEVTLTDFAGNTVVLHPGDPGWPAGAAGLLTVISSGGDAYAEWANDLLPGLPQGPQADPDRDGRVNAMEFALGSDPKQGNDDPALLPRLVAAEPGSGSKYRFIHRRRTGAAGAAVRYEPEQSAALLSGSWGPLAAGGVSNAVGGGWEEVSWPLGSAGEATAFARLRVVLSTSVPP